MAEYSGSSEIIIEFLRLKKVGENVDLDSLYEKYPELAGELRTYIANEKSSLEKPQVEDKKQRKVKKFEAAKKQVIQLLQQGEFKKAISILKKMSDVEDPDVTDYVVWAKKELPEARKMPRKFKDGILVLIELSKDLIEKNDYQQVIAILEQIPVAYRSDEASDLLEEAIAYQEESELLLTQLNNAVWNKNFIDIDESLSRYLELKPSSRFAIELNESLETYSHLSIDDRDYQFDEDGNLKPLLEDKLAPQLVKIAFAGVAVFAVTLVGVLYYLNTADSGEERFRRKTDIAKNSDQSKNFVPLDLRVIEQVDVQESPKNDALEFKKFQLVQQQKGNDVNFNTIRITPDQNVYSLLVTPQGIELRDEFNDVVLHNLNGDTQQTGICFSRDGSLVVTSENGNTISIWNTKTGQKIQSINQKPGEFIFSAFSNDNTILSVSNDQNSMRILEVKTGNELLKLVGHASKVEEICFSNDNLKIASCSDDTTVRIWDAKSGAQIHLLNGHEQIPLTVEFNSSGSTVASGGQGGQLKLWDVKTGEIIRTISNDKEAIQKIAFSSNDKMIATGSPNGQVKIWSALTGELLQTLENHSTEIMDLVFSSKGSQFASVDSKANINIWSIDGTAPPKMEPPSVKPTQIFTKADLLNPTWIEKRIRDVGVDQLLDDYSKQQDSSVQIVSEALKLSQIVLRDNPQAVYEQLQARMIYRIEPELQAFKNLPTDGIFLHSTWDSFTQSYGKVQTEPASNLGIVMGMAITPDRNYMLLGLKDNSIKLWEPKTGRTLLTYNGHERFCNHLKVTRDGTRVVACDFGNLLKVWDLASGKEIRSFNVGKFGVNKFTVSPDGKFAVTAHDGHAIRVWDLSSGRLVRKYENTTSPYSAQRFKILEISHDGKFLITSTGGVALTVYDFQTLKYVGSLTGHKGWINSLAISSDGKVVVSGSEDKTLKTWDLTNGEAINTFRGHQGAVKAVAISEDSSLIISISENGTIRTWDSRSGDQLRIVEVGESQPNFYIGSDQLLVVEKGKKLFCGFSSFGGNTLRPIDLVKENAVLAIGNHANLVNRITVLSNGKELITGSSDGTLRRMEIETGRKVQSYKMSSPILGSVDIFPNEKQVIFSSNDSSLNLFHLATGRIIRKFKGHSKPVTCFEIIQDGKQVISGSEDNSLRMWDVQSGQSFRELKGHTASVNCVSISDDEKIAISGSDDNTLKAWDLKRVGTEKTFKGHKGPITGVSISEDDQRFVSSSADKTAIIWNLSTGDPAITLTGHTDVINCVEVFSGRDLVITGSNDKTLKLWNLTTGKLLKTYYLDDIPKVLEASPGETSIIIGGSTGKVHNLKLLL